MRQRCDCQCERRYARVTEESSNLLMGLKGTQLAGFKLRGRKVESWLAEVTAPYQRGYLFLTYLISPTTFQLPPAT